MPIKPYEPNPIEGFKVSLTKRQELAHVRKALEMSKDAKRYWPNAEWTALLADLGRQEAELAAEIKRTDEAVYNKAYLRPHFICCANNLDTHCIVNEPNDKVDMPWITEERWQTVCRLLNDPTGDNIEVDADYEVYVAHKCGYIHRIIPRYE